MKTKIPLALLILSICSLFMTSCGDKDDVELLKSRLNSAINDGDQFETAGLLDKLVKLGVDPKTLPIEESVELIRGRADRAYNWETITGEELVRLYGPLEGLRRGTWTSIRFAAPISGA